MRVHKKTKNKGIKHATYPCRKCSKPIKAGDQYYEWQFKHAPPSRQHIGHGYPRQSELMTGKLSGVYGAIEGCEDAFGIARKTNEPTGLADSLRACAEEVDNVKDEYQSSLENMPEPLQQSSTGEAIQEKIDALEQFSEELNSAADEVESTLEEIEEEPESMDEHKEDCPTAIAENDDNDAPELPACECGYDDAEATHDEWDATRDEKINEAFERAEGALQELNL